MDKKKEIQIVRATNAKQDPDRKSLFEFVLKLRKRSESRTHFARKGLSLQRIIARQDQSFSKENGPNSDASRIPLASRQEQRSPRRYEMSDMLKREDIVAQKENNLDQYFKEKFHIMNQFLGEKVLNDNLFQRRESYREKESREEDLFFDEKMDLRDRYLMKIIKKETYAKNLDSRAINKVMEMNQKIGMKILNDEHGQKMEKLQDLQIQHNMHILSEGNKEFGEGKAVYWLNQKKGPMPKVILKSNFVTKNWLKEFVEQANQNKAPLGDEDILSKKKKLDNLEPTALKFKTPIIGLSQAQSNKTSKRTTPRESRAATPALNMRKSDNLETADTANGLLRLSKPHEQTYTRHASTGRIIVKIGEPWTDGKEILKEERSFIEFKEKKKLFFDNITPIKSNQTGINATYCQSSMDVKSKTPAWLNDSHVSDNKESAPSVPLDTVKVDLIDQLVKETQATNNVKEEKKEIADNKITAKVDAQTSTVPIAQYKMPAPIERKKSSRAKSRNTRTRSREGDESSEHVNYMAQPKIFTIRFEEKEKQENVKIPKFSRFHMRSFSTQYGDRFWSHTSELF